MRLRLLLLIFSTSHATNWVRITRPSIVWESLKVNEQGERRIFCDHFDEKYRGKYHWRFNGSSVLPERTQIHKDQFVFLSEANAVRNSFQGEYVCCVRESLGNACYTRTLTVKNKTTQKNIDLTESDDLWADEGDSYYIKLVPNKRVEGVHCRKHGSNSTDSNIKYPIFGKNTKLTTSYHLKIEHLETFNLGSYTCDVRLPKKEIIQKIYKFDSERHLQVHQNQVKQTWLSYQIYYFSF